MTIAPTDLIVAVPIVISLAGYLLSRKQFRLAHSQIEKKADSDSTSAEIALLKTQLTIVGAQVQECHNNLSRAEGERDSYLRQNAAYLRQVGEMSQEILTMTRALNERRP